MQALDGIMIWYLGSTKFRGKALANEVLVSWDQPIVSLLRSKMQGCLHYLVLESHLISSVSCNLPIVNLAYSISEWAIGALQPLVSPLQLKLFVNNEWQWGRFNHWKWERERERELP